MKDYILNRIKEMKAEKEAEKEAEKILKRWTDYGQAGRFLQGLGVGIVFMSAVGGYMFYRQSHLPESDPCHEAQEAGFNQGKYAGALAVVNEDRKSTGLKPFKSWDDYVASADIKGWDAFNAEMDQMFKDKKEADKKFPVKKPWAKK